MTAADAAYVTAKGAYVTAQGAYVTAQGANVTAGAAPVSAACTAAAGTPARVRKALNLETSRCFNKRPEVILEDVYSTPVHVAEHSTEKERISERNR